MSFKRYLAESERKFNYRIKTVASMDDTHWAAINRFLQRYHLIDFGKPHKTVIQTKPLDFPTLDNREVFIVDVVLGVPAVSSVLVKEISEMLHVPQIYFVIMGENDPASVIDNMNAMVGEVEGEPTALLGVDSETPASTPEVSGDNYYGDQYNSRLLNVMRDIANERNETMKVDPPAPLFSWLDMPKEEETEDFNKEFRAKTKEADKDAKSTTRFGNFDDDDTGIRRTVKVDGKKKTVDVKPDSIRKVAK